VDFSYASDYLPELAVIDSFVSLTSLYVFSFIRVVLSTCQHKITEPNHIVIIVNLNNFVPYENQNISA